MRWRLPDQADETEAAARRAWRAKCDQFWSEFQRDEGQLRAAHEKSDMNTLVGWFMGRVPALDERLMWEAGGRADSQMRLVLTTESERALWPLADEVIKRAPQIAGWEFLAERPACKLENVEAEVAARGRVSIADWRFGARQSDHHFVDVSAKPSGWKGKSAAVVGAFSAGEAILGERRAAIWLGDMRGYSSSLLGRLGRALGRKEEMPALPLEAWRDAIESHIRSFLAELPSSPIYEKLDREAAEYAMYECRAREGEADYPGRQDIVVGGSARMDITGALMMGGFFSERYSRCGERFCYLKIESPLKSQPLEQRDELADPVDAALRANGLGCNFGAASGLRYWYIDLALTDAAAAVPLVRAILREQRVTRRAWLLFSDADWANEWVGIWPDSPRPPGKSMTPSILPTPPAPPRIFAQ